MREIHDRMPVILDSSVLGDWLNPEIHEREILQELLLPCPNKWLSATEVSWLVNSPQNNSPEVLQPAGTVEDSGRCNVVSLRSRHARRLLRSNAERQVVVLVESATLRQAERLIESCEYCNQEGAQIHSITFWTELPLSTPT